MTRRWTSGAVAVFVLAVVVLSIGHATAADWSARIEVAEGNAEHGPWRMNESDWDYLSDPTVAIADDGHAGVAWSDQASQNIFFQMYTPDGAARFAEPVNASNHPGIFSWLPRMVIPGDDPQRVYLLWQEIIFTGAAHGGDIFFARSRDGGETFSEPLNLSNSEAGAGKGRLTEERWDNGSLTSYKGRREPFTPPGASMRAGCSSAARPMAARHFPSRCTLPETIRSPPVDPRWRWTARGLFTSPGRLQRTPPPTFKS